MDRGVSQAVPDYISSQWSRKFPSQFSHLSSASSVPEEASGLRAYEVHTYAGCFLHDAHNALKWGLMWLHGGEAAVLSDAFL
eukprot:6483137-Amphidinium_carterae.1